MNNPRIIDIIFECVEHVTGITREEIKEQLPKSKRVVYEARYMAYYMLRKHTTASLATIGKITGRKDHSAIVHGINAMENLFETNEGFRRAASTVENMFLDKIMDVNLELLPNQLRMANIDDLIIRTIEYLGKLESYKLRLLNTSVLTDTEKDLAIKYKEHEKKIPKNYIKII
jgi:hypothetical protein